MMYDLKRVGKNIRSLRQAVGESQERLGEAVGVTKNAINMYEMAKREPSKGTLSKIASHYMVSVDELIHSDLSDLQKLKFNNNAFLENIELVLPIMTSENAEKNKHFRRALEAHRRLYDGLHKLSLEDVDCIDICFDGYMEVCDDEIIGAEASADLIAIWYLLQLFTVTGMIMMDRPALITQLAVRDKKTRNALDAMEDKKDDFERDLQKAGSAFKSIELIEHITELKKRLKQSSRFSNLCDYYLALQYFWNFEDNDLTIYFNRRIGVEMLNAFSSVGNCYAARFLEFCLNTMGISG